MNIDGWLGTMRSPIDSFTWRGQYPGRAAYLMLQLGRALALSGDLVKSKTAYQDFLTLWKDADPNIPILKQAKAGYAKLQ